MKTIDQVISAEEPIFSGEHAGQYKMVSDDMRFYADQRFKIMSIYMITNGLLANVAKDHSSMILAAIGMVLSYCCFAWDVGTTRWWGTLIERAKELEEMAIKQSKLIAVYNNYSKQNPKSGLHRLAFLRPSLVAATMYFCGLVGWGLFFIPSWGRWW